jgi:hypothetical protein
LYQIANLFFKFIHNEVGGRVSELKKILLLSVGLLIILNADLAANSWRNNPLVKRLWELNKAYLDLRGAGHWKDLGTHDAMFAKNSALNSLEFNKMRKAMRANHGVLPAEALLPGYYMPGTSFGYAEAQLQAKTLLTSGTHEHFETLWRVDSRTPKQMLETGRFTPNPKLPPGTIDMHVRTSGGTGSWVSMTSMEEPLDIVDMIAKYTKGHPVYQYEIKNIEAISLHSINEAEAEVVARAVNVTAGSRVRQFFSTMHERMYRVRGIRYDLWELTNDIIVSPWMNIEDAAMRMKTRI